MKKIKILMLLIFTSMLLSSCAAEEPFTEDVSIYGDLTFDFATMTYTNTTQNDILYRVGNPFDDFVILHQEVLNESLTQNELDSYEILLTNMSTLSELSDELMITLVSYTSSNLKDAFDNNDLSLTLDDIVTFNALKLKIENIKETLGEEKSIIRKLEYIQYRTPGHLINEDDITNLHVMQDYYQEYFIIDQSFRIYEHTFEEFIIELQNAGFTIDQYTQTRLNYGYGIIQYLAGTI